MPVQSMHCPKCGKWATEYDTNKWQCLDCHTKFIYEPPPTHLPPPKPDVLVQHTLEMTEEGLIYVCSKCGLRFSRLTKPNQTCVECGAPVCPDCFLPSGKMCASCYTLRVQKEEAARIEWGRVQAEKKVKEETEGKMFVGGCLVVCVIIGLVAFSFLQNSTFVKEILHPTPAEIKWSGEKVVEVPVSRNKAVTIEFPLNISQWNACAYSGKFYWINAKGWDKPIRCGGPGESVLPNIPGDRRIQVWADKETFTLKVRWR